MAVWALTIEEQEAVYLEWRDLDLTKLLYNWGFLVPRQSL